MVRNARPQASSGAAQDKVGGGQEFADAVAQVLRETVPGDVLTYGDVADSAGFPGAARAVGRALGASDGLPWWRVVTASGRLVPGLESEHAALLRKEGVELRNGRVRAG